MSTTKKTTRKPAAKKTTAKKAPTKQAPKGAATNDVAAKGVDLVALGDVLKGAGMNGSTAPTITKLSEAKVPTNAQLIALRDAVNARAAELREAKKIDDASELSRANRSVRKLERATR